MQITPSPAAKGFTLLELLVTVAIIALLASLLLPALSRAKAAVAAAKCKSNEKQMGLALWMYVDDFRVFPLSVYSPAGNAKNAFYWFDGFALYMPGTKWGSGVFKCPTYKGRLLDGSGDHNGAIVAEGSYAYNAWGAETMNLGSHWGRTGLGPPQVTPATLEPNFVYKYVQESNINAPAEMYAFGDARIIRLPNGVLSGMFEYSPARFWKTDEERLRKLPHVSTRFNMLFVDGHVDAVKTNTLFSDDPDSLRRWNSDNLP